AFCKRARNVGAEGLIVPDVPPEENREGYWTKALGNSLFPVPIVSPITPDFRLRKIAKQAQNRGFVYCVSTNGTTGARKALPPNVRSYLKNVREHFDVPLALGFGISKREHVRALRGYAEIAIVGSATIDLIRKSSKKSRVRAISKFMRSLVL